MLYLDEIKELKKRVETKGASCSYAEYAYKEEKTRRIALEEKLAIYSEDVADLKKLKSAERVASLASHQLRRVCEKIAESIIKLKKHRSKHWGKLQEEKERSAELDKVREANFNEAAKWKEKFIALDEDLERRMLRHTVGQKKWPERRLQNMIRNRNEGG